MISVLRWQSEAKFQNIHSFRLNDMNSRWIKTGRNIPTANSKKWSVREMKVSKNSECLAQNRP